jgi:hypothetical protein
MLTLYQGLPNEHICASALYYYDSSNVTDSYLAFRENANAQYLTLLGDYEFSPGPGYEQSKFQSLVAIFGLGFEHETDYEVRLTHN